MNNVPPFYRIDYRFEGNPTHTIRLKELANAKLFVDLLVGKKQFKWASSSVIIVVGKMTIECDRLEDIMECEKKGKLDDDVKEGIATFLENKGVWRPGLEQDASSPAPRKQRTMATSGDEQIIPLSDICKRNKWEDRWARGVLRAAKEEVSGRWQWSRSEADRIERLLRAKAGNR